MEMDDHVHRTINDICLEETSINLNKRLQQNQSRQADKFAHHRRLTSLLL